MKEIGEKATRRGAREKREERDSETEAERNTHRKHFLYLRSVTKRSARAVDALFCFDFPSLLASPNLCFFMLIRACPRLSLLPIIDKFLFSVSLGPLAARPLDVRSSSSELMQAIRLTTKWEDVVGNDWGHGRVAKRSQVELGVDRIRRSVGRNAHRHDRSSRPASS